MNFKNINSTLFRQILLKYYWVIPILIFLFCYHNEEIWRYLPQDQFVNIKLSDTDSTVFNKLKGYVYLSPILDSSSRENILLDINHADRVDFWVNEQKVDPEIVEFRLNRTGHQKHFAIPVRVKDNIKIRLSIFKTDSTKKVVVRTLTSESFHNLKADFYFADKNTNLFIIMMLGAFILQVIYVIMLALTRMRMEYFFYFLYCFEYTRLNFIFFQHQLGFDLGVSLYPNDVFFSTMLLFIGNAAFVRYFFRDFKIPTALIAEGLSCINLILYSTVYDNPISHADFATKSFLILYFSCILLIYPIFFIKDKLKYFILTGSLIVLLGAIVSRMMFAFYPEAEYDHYSIRMLTYLLDFILLNSALNYRNNQEKQAQQKKLENERNRIASEIHDDLGAGLSTIRLLSEMAQSSIHNPEKQQQIRRITNQSNDLIEKMSTIIWAINSRNDTVEGLLAYLRRYAFEYLEPLGLNCHFELPETTPSVLTTVLTGEIRRQVFLTFKEALHNIIKHAGAKDVTISSHFNTNSLEIIIKDNGKGFKNQTSIGNGLKNMNDRMEAIGGSFSFLPSVSEGVTIVLSIPTNKS